jgi:hypothetical protein
MFAPICPTCRRRVLLGSGRIIGFATAGDGAHTVMLRCFCGELVEWRSRPRPVEPTPSAAAAPPPPRTKEVAGV